MDNAKETVRWGILGVAKIGRRVVPAMQRAPHCAVVAIASRDERKASDAAARLGIPQAYGSYEALLDDPDIDAIYNPLPNHLHVPWTIRAAEAGKHVLCEKPLGRTAEESYEIWQRVEATGVKHMTAFNYRFVPAVRLAREMIEAGDLGEIRHFRGRYLQEWGSTTAEVWRFEREAAGSGALGDLGAHVIDLARYLVGEIGSVSASTRTFSPGREVDDAFEAVAEFENGAVGTLEASRFAPGRKNAFSWEINGSKGSLGFDLERLNELQWSEGTQGFQTILVSEADHPFWEWWWPHGHTIGWEHTFVHELHHLLAAIAADTAVGPHGATFEDGYAAAEVCDAILRSAESGRRERILRQ